MPGRQTFAEISVGLLMSDSQLRSDAVAQHQHQVVSLLQENGLSIEYNETNGVFEPDSYMMALFKVRRDASSAATVL
jgi:hypothetical protein